jgi:hypothetical protein
MVHNWYTIVPTCILTYFHRSSIPESKVPDLHQKAIDLLNLLKKNLPDKTGEKRKWNFEKARSGRSCCGALEVRTGIYLLLLGMR